MPPVRTLQHPAVGLAISPVSTAMAGPGPVVARVEGAEPTPTAAGLSPISG